MEAHTAPSGSEGPCCRSSCSRCCKAMREAGSFYGLPSLFTSHLDLFCSPHLAQDRTPPPVVGDHYHDLSTAFGCLGCVFLGINSGSESRCKREEGEQRNTHQVTKQHTITVDGETTTRARSRDQSAETEDQQRQERSAQLEEITKAKERSEILRTPPVGSTPSRRLPALRPSPTAAFFGEPQDYEN